MQSAFEQAVADEDHVELGETFCVECVSRQPVGGETSLLNVTQACDAGSGYAEPMPRALKSQLLRLRRFDTIEALCLALIAWQMTSDERRQMERYGSRSPVQLCRQAYGALHK